VPIFLADHEAAITVVEPLRNSCVAGDMVITAEAADRLTAHRLTG